MKVENSDIDTAHLDIGLQEELQSGNVHQKYGALLYLACSVAAGDKSSVDRLKKLIEQGKK